MSSRNTLSPYGRDGELRKKDPRDQTPPKSSVRSDTTEGDKWEFPHRGTSRGRWFGVKEERSKEAHKCSNPNHTETRGRNTREKKRAPEREEGEGKAEAEKKRNNRAYVSEGKPPAPDRQLTTRLRALRGADTPVPGAERDHRDPRRSTIQTTRLAFYCNSGIYKPLLFDVWGA